MSVILQRYMKVTRQQEWTNITINVFLSTQSHGYDTNIYIRVSIFHFIIGYLRCRLQNSFIRPAYYPNPNDTERTHT